MRARNLKTESGILKKCLEKSILFLYSFNFSRTSIKVFIKVLLISLLLNSKSELVAQCKPQVWCFEPGEELYYDILYNWGFIWVDAARVEFKAKKEILEDKEVFHFSGTGISLPKHDWFFKVRDYFDSWADLSDLAPIKHSRNTSEGKYKVDEKYNFDYTNRKIYSNIHTSEKARKLDTIYYQNCVFDIMTAVYYARTIDLDKYKENQKIPLSMIVDNKIYNLYGRYLGKETIKNRNKKPYNCLKFSILLVEGTMFKGGEDLFVWISDDANRIPILIEAQVIVGSVKAYIKDTKNIKYPAVY